MAITIQSPCSIFPSGTYSLGLQIFHTISKEVKYWCTIHLGLLFNADWTNPKPSHRHCRAWKQIQAILLFSTLLPFAFRVSINLQTLLVGHAFSQGETYKWPLFLFPPICSNGLNMSNCFTLLRNTNACHWPMGEFLATHNYPGGGGKSCCFCKIMHRCLRGFLCRRK